MPVSHPKNGVLGCPILAGMRLKLFMSALLVCAMPAYAIPSPDLVINAFVSAAQIAGLLAAMSGAALLRLRRRSSGASAHASRWLSVFGTVAMLAILLNVWQYASHVSADSRRLETNLWRKPPDWERAFAAPTLTSAELAARMNSGTPLHLVDVREPEEFEVTHLPGAINLRYADLLLGVRKPPEDGVPVVFVCDSGKRSGEVCEQRARLGLPCHVLEGGYPQWVREDRPLSTPTYGVWRARFTPLPRYARDTVYLDTPEVSVLVRNDKARFIDVRSPDEFARGHLPDALNLPMRGMASDALTDALVQLPVQPLIAACYDNRSCFHARVLGLKLTRLGQDFRGRYTVPQEFPVPTQIAASGTWPRVQRVLSTAIDKAVEPLARGIAWSAAHVGGLVPSMLMLLLLTRLPLAPLAAKAQRDRRSMRAIADQTARLRAHYADDVFRLQRAVRQLRGQHGLTPWRNLAIAVTTCALTWRLLLGTAMPNVLRGAFAALAAMLMLWLCWDLSAAISLYLLASMALLWLQQRPWAERAAQLRSWWSANRAQLRAQSLAARPLEHCTAADAVGNKAWRQGQMRLVGLPVPHGWVWPAQHTEPAEVDVRAELDTLGLDPHARYAVRSSGIAEDTAAQSMAGVFRSELQLPLQDVPAAMQRVRAFYGMAADAQGKARGGGVIVQVMVEAEFAGVLFTCAPGNAGAMLIEWVAGLGEALASGRATPGALQVGRVSGLLLDVTVPCPLDVGPLVALAQSIERQFGGPQDIEWAFAGGRFYILQARDVVAPPATAEATWDAHACIAQERARLLRLLAPYADRPDAPALVQTDMTADLPWPTPLSLSMLQRIRGDGGSTDRAFERLGLRWQAGPHGTVEVQSAFGQTYVLQALAQASPMGMLASFYLSRSAASLEADFRNSFLPGHQEAMRWREVMDLRALSDAELMTTLQTWTRQFVEVHYVEADIINIAAEFYARASAKALAAKGLSPALVASAASAKEHSAVPTLATHGHRAVHDWELSEPRYCEDPQSFTRHFGVGGMAHIASAHGDGVYTGAAVGTGRKLLHSSLLRAERFVRLKEEAKHALLREWAQIRRLLLVVDQRLVGDSLVFYLELAELPALLGSDKDALLQRARGRRAQVQAFREVVVGPSLSLRELEARTDWLKAYMARGSAAIGSDGLQGQRVSGRQQVTAAVRVLRHADDLVHLRAGEIAVVALADPVWLGTFDRASGLVSEVGGWLAHLAILAREKDMPAVFGVAGALQQLRTGDVVTLGVDGRVRLQERV